MSKNNNHKGKENNAKDSFIDSKLKESNVKYNNAKDIEVISRNYIKESNTAKNSEASKKMTNRITKLQIIDKNGKNDVEEKESEKDNENENLTDRIKENLPSWNEKGKFLDKIKELEEKIKQINIDHSKDIQKYKEEIEKKEKDIKKLINTNNNLKISLETLTQRLDKILVNSNQQKIKIAKTINTNQEELQHQLDIKEKELKNQQQLINILSKDNKNIRNILNNFNNFGINENNLNLKEKIQQQYQEIQNLQKNLKEYKLKLEQKQSSTQKNITSKNINFNTDEENSSPKKLNYFLHKNKKIKIKLNSISGSAYNIHKKYNNKSQSVDLKDNQKKLNYRGINSSFSNNNNNNNNIVETMFTTDEINAVRSSFYDEQKYENFMNKINILDKASKSKEKEMNMKIKLIENKLKEKEKELLEVKKLSREKESKIITLNILNKELKKNKEDLMNKINFLAQTLNELDLKNQMILKKNEQIKNSIFNIDGIIEAKSLEGKSIPLLIEVKDNSNNTEKKDKKNGNESINQSSREDKNSDNYSNND
jgi:hypothetical protein